MNLIIKSLKDNRSLSMSSGNATLEDVQSFTSKAGNPTIKAIFRQSGTDEHEMKGIDDVIKTTNINEFQKSIQRFYYLFTSVNQQQVFIDQFPEEAFYTQTSDKPLVIDSKGLFEEAVSQKRDKINLLEETLKERCEDYKTNENDVISYSYEYDSKEKTYKATFYKIDQSLFNKTLEAIENSLRTLIGNEYYVNVKEYEKTKNGAKFIDYKAVGYRAA